MAQNNPMARVTSERTTTAANIYIFPIILILPFLAQTKIKKSLAQSHHWLKDQGLQCPCTTHASNKKSSSKTTLLLKRTPLPWKQREYKLRQNKCQENFLFRIFPIIAARSSVMCRSKLCRRKSEITSTVVIKSHRDLISWPRPLSLGGFCNAKSVFI